ncbi:MAG: asparaginase [SAR202 cluster bacterium]|nr:asparaginase [SAR202 cluster bacterium]
MARKPTVMVLGTGGSIASIGPHRLDYTTYPEVGHRIPVAELLGQIPEAKKWAKVESEDIVNEASGALTPLHWLDMARRINKVLSGEGVDGVVLTHGTATLEETAFFLHLTVKSDKPVVVTGAMRPASAVGTDAHINLLNSIQAAASPEAAGRGVMVMLNNQIHSARDVIKSDTYRVETFKSYDLGLLGYADSDHEVRFYRRPDKRHTSTSEFNVGRLKEMPRVEMVYNYTGASGLLVDAVTKSKSDGLVLVGLGSGNTTPWVEAAAVRAVKACVAVVLASRVNTGRVMLTPKKGKLGLVVCDNLLPQKARVLLMLGLTKTKEQGELQRMFYEY